MQKKEGALNRTVSFIVVIVMKEDTKDIGRTDVAAQADNDLSLIHI